MSKRLKKQTGASDPVRKLAEGLSALSNQILAHANRGLPRVDFMREVSKMLLDFSGCDAVELRLNRGDKCYCFEAMRSRERLFRFEIIPCAKDKNGNVIPCGQGDSDIEKLCRSIFLGNFDCPLPLFTINRTFWTGDLEKSGIFRLESTRRSNIHSFRFGVEYRSLALFPLIIYGQSTGLLLLKSRQRNYFTQSEIEFYERLDQILVVALAHRSAQVALRERIKELTCLYGIARIVAQTDISLDKILRSITELLPPAWLYPEITSARIVLDGHEYSTRQFQENPQKQRADVIVSGEVRGVVEVSYAEEKPELD